MENNTTQIEKLKTKERLILTAIQTIEGLHPATIISNYYKGNILVFSTDATKAEWFTPSQMELINISILDNEVLQGQSIRTKADAIAGLYSRLNNLTITIEKLIDLATTRRTEYLKLHGLSDVFPTKKQLHD